MLEHELPKKLDLEPKKGERDGDYSSRNEKQNIDMRMTRESEQW